VSLSAFIFGFISAVDSTYEEKELEFDDDFENNIDLNEEGHNDSVVFVNGGKM